MLRHLSGPGRGTFAFSIRAPLHTAAFAPMVPMGKRKQTAKRTGGPNMIMRKVSRRGPMRPGDTGIDGMVEVRKLAAARWLAIGPGGAYAEVCEDRNAARGYAGPDWAVSSVLFVEQEYDLEDERPEPAAAFDFDAQMELAHGW